jgi:dipeptidyl aminopeptidase/acylaminoacyl peptidase
VYSSGPLDAATTRPVGVDATGRCLFVLSPAGANAARALSIEIATGRVHALCEDPTYDVVNLSLSPSTGAADLAVVHRERRHIVAVHPGTVDDVARLRSIFAGDVMVLDRTADDRRWLVLDFRDDGPSSYYVYDRCTGRPYRLFSHQPVLAQYTLARVEPFSFTARDGLTIHGYLTFPPGIPRRELPTVLAVHGGPWSRDLWGSGGDAQWLANRGYLCMQVNFRGSTGYGKDFVNAGDREWGGRMQDDLVDAARWAVDRGYADPRRIAIYGSSYGGYAALVGATFPPPVFRCAIAVSAPSDLRTFVRSAMRTSALMSSRLRRCIGDPVTDADFLWSRSPLSRVGDVGIPVLVAHGANDPRVPRTEAERIVAALRANGLPHRYLLFEDEGHGFARPENRMAFYAAAELFLAEHLGGRSEPTAS